MKARRIVISAAALLIVGAEPVLASEALARINGCFQCHSAEKGVSGPTFEQIAARHKGAAAARRALIQTVKRGGKGNWTAITRGVPMPPYSPRLSDADIQRLVDWVLISRAGSRGR